MQKYMIKILRITVEMKTNLKLNLMYFTLIELLVVIAIIAILAGILLPSIKKAKDKALELRCKASVKQIATAIIMYPNEYNEWMVPFKGTSNLSSSTDPNFWYNLIDCNGNTSKLMIDCPSAKNRSNNNYRDVAFGYARNLTGYNYGQFVKLNKVRKPSSAISVSDSQTPDDYNAWNSDPPSARGFGIDPTVYFSHYRHGNRNEFVLVTGADYYSLSNGKSAIANFGFIDGHTVGLTPSKANEFNGAAIEGNWRTGFKNWFFATSWINADGTSGTAP